MTESRSTLERRLAARLGSSTEARWIVDEVLGRPGGASGADGADGGVGAGAGHGPAVSGEARARADVLAERRLAGEPLQYVLGSWAFRTLDLIVDERVLIPRPETEQVVEVALAELRRLDCRAGPGPVVADLGTGSGAIALSLAAELPGAEVWATDDDPAALGLAAHNLERLTAHVADVGDRVHLVAGSWYGALPPNLAGRLTAIVSNPPYVSEAEWATLDPAVRREPRHALVAGPSSEGTDGLGAVEDVVVGASRWLAPGGVVVVELAPHQAAPAAGLAQRAGLRDARIEPDLAGRDRAVVARR